MDVLRRFNVRQRGRGDGGRVILFAHGFGSNQSVWTPIWQRFRPGMYQYHLVSFDLACAGTVPGFLLSDYQDIHAYVDDVIAIMDALAIQRCTYIGHSMGATIGILASISHPHRFDELILINFSPRFLNDPGTNYHGGLEREDIEQMLAAIAQDFAAMVANYAPRLVGPLPQMTDELHEFTRMILRMPPQVAHHVVQTTFSCDLRDQLPLVSVPCCIIQSIDDVAIPSPAMAQYVASLLVVPHTIYMLNGRGHMPHLTSPGETTRLLLRHLFPNL